MLVPRAGVDCGTGGGAVIERNESNAESSNPPVPLWADAEVVSTPPQAVQGLWSVENTQTNYSAEPFR